MLRKTRRKVQLELPSRDRQKASRPRRRPSAAHKQGISSSFSMPIFLLQQIGVKHPCRPKVAVPVTSKAILHWVFRFCWRFQAGRWLPFDLVLLGYGGCRQGRRLSLMCEKRRL